MAPGGRGERQNTYYPATYAHVTEQEMCWHFYGGGCIKTAIKVVPQDFMPVLVKRTGIFCCHLVSNFCDPMGKENLRCFSIKTENDGKAAQKRHCKLYLYIGKDEISCIQ